MLISFKFKLRFSLLIVKFVCFAQINAPSLSVGLLQSIAVIFKMRLTFLFDFFLPIVEKRPFKLEVLGLRLGVCASSSAQSMIKAQFLI